MFSVFKKLTSKNDASHVSIPESVGQTMSESLKKRFSRGVQYNMKVVIKGDRNVGKSCLLERLQGKAFLEQYTPTEQIQVASIQWSFKATDDIVKVEVWDVVDRGKSKQKNAGLKLNINNVQDDAPALDAEFLDVYKGTHCVVMMMDITKSWTFDYVCRELPKVPEDIPVLLLGNHCDMGHHRVTTKDEIIGFIETISLNRATEIVYGDSSMRNGFGLRLLHKFFGIPFLYLQKSTLEATLKKNLLDLDICRLEVTEYQRSDDSDYARFLDNLISKKKAKEETQSNVQFSESAIPRSSKSIILGAGHPIVIPHNKSHLAVAPATTVNTAKIISPVELISKSQTVSSDASLNKISDVDEFCPDGGMLDKSFLEDATEMSPTAHQVINNESDSDEDHCNPLVSHFDDDVADVADDLAQPQKNESSKQSFHKSFPARATDSTRDGNAKHTEGRKVSLSSVDFEMERILPIEVKKISVNSSDYDKWPPDTKERRSPEGGEDVDSTSSVTYKSGDKKSTNEKEKKHKKKKSSKEKDESYSEKRRNKRKSHVDNFVKEMQSTSAYPEDAYEAI